MNTFASGSSVKAQALVLALALPGMLTTWMLNQPDIVGQARAGTNPIATISDVGQTLDNQNIALDAGASFDPNKSNARLSYTWNFGDGATASGISVSHRYTTTGIYTLSLAVGSAKGIRRVNKIINMVTQATRYDNPYAQYLSNGAPPGNPAVILPTPDDSQSGRVPTISTPLVPNSTAGNAGGLIRAIVIVLVILLGAAVLIWIRRRV